MASSFRGGGKEGGRVVGVVTITMDVVVGGSRIETLISSSVRNVRRQVHTVNTVQYVVNLATREMCVQKTSSH